MLGRIRLHDVSYIAAKFHVSRMDSTKLRVKVLPWLERVKAGSRRLIAVILTWNIKKVPDRRKSSNMKNWRRYLRKNGS